MSVTTTSKTYTRSPVSNYDGPSTPTRSTPIKRCPTPYPRRKAPAIPPTPKISPLARPLPTTPASSGIGIGTANFSVPPRRKLRLQPLARELPSPGSYAQKVSGMFEKARRDLVRELARDRPSQYPGIKSGTHALYSKSPAMQGNPSPTKIGETVLGLGTGEDNSEKSSSISPVSTDACPFDLSAQPGRHSHFKQSVNQGSSGDHSIHPGYAALHIDENVTESEIEPLNASFAALRVQSTASVPEPMQSGKVGISQPSPLRPTCTQTSAILSPSNHAFIESWLQTIDTPASVSSADTSSDHIISIPAPLRLKPRQAPAPPPQRRPRMPYTLQDPVPSRFSSSSGSGGLFYTPPPIPPRNPRRTFIPMPQHSPLRASPRRPHVVRKLPSNWFGAVLRGHRANAVVPSRPKPNIGVSRKENGPAPREARSPDPGPVGVALGLSPNAKSTQSSPIRKDRSSVLTCDELARQTIERLGLYKKPDAGLRETCMNGRPSRPSMPSQDRAGTLDPDAQRRAQGTVQVFRRGRGPRTPRPRCGSYFDEDLFA